MTTLRQRKVAVIGGGANDEHDVSLASAAAVARAVRELGDEVHVTQLAQINHMKGMLDRLA